MLRTRRTRWTINKNISDAPEARANTFKLKNDSDAGRTTRVPTKCSGRANTDDHKTRRAQTTTTKKRAGPRRTRSAADWAGAGKMRGQGPYHELLLSVPQFAAAGALNRPRPHPSPTRPR